jgi:sugar phosphate isomerase/epimerase
MPHVAVYRLGDRVFHCHVSDNDALTNAHWRPGMGKIDWRRLLQSLRDVGFDGTVSIELEDVPEVSTPRNPTAGPRFDEEMRLGREYLLRAAEGLGISWS